MGTGRSGAALGRMGTGGGDLEQPLGGWEQAEADGNRESRSSRSGRWPPPGRRGWLEGGCGPPPSGAAEVGMGWRGVASLRVDAEGTTWSGRWLRAGDQETWGGRLVKTGAY